MNSIRILLQSAIDYAGLFPPASLGMADAIREYASSRKIDFAWAIGRFVLPVSRLEEFEAGAADSLPRGPAEPPWYLSVLTGSDWNGDLELVSAFNERHSPGSAAGAAVIEAIESRVRAAREIHRSSHAAASRLERYFEVPLAEGTQELVAAIARTGGRGKVRTGGVTPEQFPSSAELSRFINLCAQAGVAFKATAGLHHPFRAKHRLTYNPVSPSGMMHGFLNVLLAAACARSGKDAAMLRSMLDEGAADAFRFDDDGAAWRAERLTIGQLLDARQHSMISFGSCSIQEPRGDLKALNLI